jgi:hypothetical protein
MTTLDLLGALGSSIIITGPRIHRRTLYGARFRGDRRRPGLHSFTMVGSNQPSG